jgi:hypothetical protein
MRYTVRYAHLRNLPIWRVGDVIKRGKMVGVMGNTGVSTGPHLHIDSVEGFQTSLWRLRDYETGEVISAHRQIQHFIDDELDRVSIRAMREILGAMMDGKEPPVKSKELLLQRENEVIEKRGIIRV